MKKFLILSLAFVLIVQAEEYEYPFRNPNLSTTERVNDLVSRLTLKEKIGQLQNSAEAIPRLDIPKYNWWNECLHGVARNGKATVFPQAIALGATFDPSLVRNISSAISTEARAKFNLCSEKGQRGQYQGLTFWSPNVNIFRDPRWGRGHETYGEDPFLTSQIGISFVEGLQQSKNSKYLKAAACAKHYAVHSGPEKLRHEFNAKASKKDMWETYLPAFESLVTGANVEGVMGAYNRTNGQSCCAHTYLMEKVLRKKWNFDGYYTSDCGAIGDIYSGHNLVDSPEKAVALALQRGTNLNCGNMYNDSLITNAIEENLISEEIVTKNVKELLETRFRLGLFNTEEEIPYSSISEDKLRCKEHVTLAQKAAEKSMVLLKNENNTLPLKKDLNQLYVTGPTATHVQALLGNYYGVSPNLVTILEGIVGEVDPATSVKYRKGSLLNYPNKNPMDWYSKVAGQSEVTVACLGLSQLIEGEEGGAIASPHRGDRTQLKLPENQLNFFDKIQSKANKLVVVLTGGSPIAIPEIYKKADAVLHVWYPGEQGGNAVADVLFGEATPSGKLPITFPKSVSDIPPYKNYSMKGRTYKYMEKEPLFPFGFGLSYTSFAYSDLKINKDQIENNENFTVKFTVKNQGSRRGEEIVQLYTSPPELDIKVPNYSLKKFQRISLKPGEEQLIEFKLNSDILKTVDQNGQEVLKPGKYQIHIGGASPMPRSKELGIDFVDTHIKVL